MAGAASKSNPPRTRKRVDTETNTLKRARNGSAFTRCEECKKDVPVVLIDMHDCSLESKIKMNLEAQVVELVKEKKKSVSSEPKQKRTKKDNKKGNDPNMPKRPPTAFFVFMEGFRKSYKEANPDSNRGSVVAKEGGEKWKSLSDEEKKEYQDRAAELKEEYKKAMEKYNADNAEDEVIEIEDAEEEQEKGGSSEKEE